LAAILARGERLLERRVECSDVEQRNVLLPHLSLLVRVGIVVVVFVRF
jgi:hypothetical protein